MPLPLLTASIQTPGPRSSLPPPLKLNLEVLSRFHIRFRIGFQGGLGERKVANPFFLFGIQGLVPKNPLMKQTQSSQGSKTAKSCDGGESKCVLHCRKYEGGWLRGQDGSVQFLLMDFMCLLRDV